MINQTVIRCSGCWKAQSVATWHHLVIWFPMICFPFHSFLSWSWVLRLNLGSSLPRVIFLIRANNSTQLNRLGQQNLSRRSERLSFRPPSFYTTLGCTPPQSDRARAQRSCRALSVDLQCYGATKHLHNSPLDECQKINNYPLTSTKVSTKLCNSRAIPLGGAVPRFSTAPVARMPATTAFSKSWWPGWTAR